VGDVCTRPDATVNVYVRDLPVAAFSANTSAGPTLTGYDVVFDATATTGGTTYNWNFGDGNTGTGITPTHTYQSNGTFTVTLIVSSLCGADTITQTVTIAGINIDEWSRENELRLYPNPTQNEVSVEFFLEGSQQVEIVLINQIGEVLQQNSLRLDGGKQQHLLQLGHLPSGVYLVKLSFNGNIVVKRVTKI
jgi:PKD repeat protein